MAAVTEDGKQRTAGFNVDANVYKVVSRICEQQDLPLRVDRHSVSVLSHVLLSFCGTFVQDAEMFAKHAGRKIVQPEDILLCARRSPNVHQRLSEVAAELSERRKARSKQRKTNNDEAQGQV